MGWADLYHVAWRNAAKCLRCNDILISHHRHDYVQCSCGAIFIDGGNDYMRYGGDMKAFQRIWIVSNSRPTRENSPL